MNLPLVVLYAAFLLILVRQIGPVRLQIRQIIPGGTSNVIVCRINIRFL